MARRRTRKVTRAMREVMPVQQSLMPTFSPPVASLPVQLQVPVMLPGTGVIAQAVLPPIIMSADWVMKIKIEQKIRKFLAGQFGKFTSNKDIYDQVKKQITPKEKNKLGGGEDADVNAAIEGALRNLELAKHISSTTFGSRYGWKLEEPGKKHGKKYGGGVWF